jgi:hypothetical protein
MAEAVWCLWPVRVKEKWCLVRRKGKKCLMSLAKEDVKVAD